MYTAGDAWRFPSLRLPLYLKLVASFKRLCLDPWLVFNVVIGMEANMVLKQTKVLGEKMQVLESLCFLELQGNTMQVPPSPGNTCHSRSCS